MSSWENCFNNLGFVMYYSKQPLPSDVIPMERMQIFFIFILSYRHCIHRLLLLL